MQTTELDPLLSSTLEAARKAGLTLVIGNKNYSSWSMRPWVAMTAFNIPFTEVKIFLDKPDTSARIADYSGAGRVPVLVAGEMTIWDSLAICEYLAEQFPEKKMWPQDVAARAMARCVSAEMHSGFGDLRTAMSMNIRRHLPGRGRTPGAQGDIGRISEIWEECLSRFGHHQFLFGEFSHLWRVARAGPASLLRPRRCPPGRGKLD
jgi:glutathione S-transferase